MARVARAVAGVAPRAGRVDVVIVDDRTIRRLNRDFRGKDKATDVLSFPYPDARGNDPVGDVFVSHQTLLRDARDLGIAPRELAVRIVVHGVLHVAGYDHMRARDAARMERRERMLLRPELTPRAFNALFD